LNSVEENKKTVLLAEDEEPLRRMVAGLLTNNGFEVIVACDGSDAIKKADEHTGPIHLLLSNVQMPEMNGVELATRLHSNRPDTKIMLMSGFPSGTLVLDHGWEFLPKPFVPKMLLDKIKLVIASEPDETIPV
jgi:two-component system cell cycle sensor histidine kinase/response regulator CckA